MEGLLNASQPQLPFMSSNVNAIPASQVNQFNMENMQPYLNFQFQSVPLLNCVHNQNGNQNKEGELDYFKNSMFFNPFGLFPPFACQMPFFVSPFHQFPQVLPFQIPQEYLDNQLQQVINQATNSNDANASMRQFSTNASQAIYPSFFPLVIPFVPQPLNQQELLVSSANHSIELGVPNMQREHSFEQIPSQNLLINQELQDQPFQNFSKSPGNQKYYKLKKGPLVQEDFDCSTDKHIKITLLRQHTAVPITEPFLLTKNGIYKTQRNTDHDDVLIGRLNEVVINNNKIYPNDIILSQNEKGISRLHCKISTKFGFNYANKLQSDFLTFLTACGQSKARLPFVAMQLIYNFVRTNPKFYLSDLGSTSGTYLRIHHHKEHEIKNQNTYLIGADTQFHVIGLMEKPPAKPKNAEYFLESLSREVSKGHIIHGLDSNELSEFQKYFANKKKSKGRQQFKLENCNRAFMKIEFTSTALKLSTVHVFFANQTALFRVGRSQDCDVVINLNTVSRKQAIIQYKEEKKKWVLTDGEDGRESANGTWESVQDYFSRQMSYKEESELKLIENQMEVKISDTILRFDFENFNLRKKLHYYKILLPRRKIDYQSCVEIINTKLTI